MENPLVSVILFYKNDRKILPETINSVLKQSYPYIEVLAIAFGSEDDSCEVIKSYGDQRILQFSVRRPEETLLINEALKLSKGKYISFIRAGDVWHPSKLENQLDLLLQRQEVAFVTSNVLYFFDDTKRNLLEGSVSRESNRRGYETISFKSIVSVNNIELSSVMINRFVLTEVGFLDKKYTEGMLYDYYLRMAHQFKALSLNKVFVYVRKTEHLLGRSQSIEVAAAQYGLSKYLYQEDIPYHSEKLVRERLAELKGEEVVALVIENQFKRARLTLKLAPKKMPMRKRAFLSMYLQSRSIARSLHRKKLQEALKGFKPVKRKRVLHLIKTMYPGDSEVNLLNIVKELDPACYDVSIGYCYGGELLQKFVKENIPTFCYSSKHARFKSFESFFIFFRLLRYVKKHNIDVIQSHSYNTYLWGGLVSRFLKVYHIENVHDARYLSDEGVESFADKNRKYKGIRFFRNLSDKTVVLTRQNKEYVVEKNLKNSSDVIQVMNGLSFASHCNQLKFRDTRNINQEDLVIVTPVLFRPDRNLDLIFQVAEVLTNQFQNVHFVIAGDGPLLKDYRKLYEMNQKMVLPGFVENIQGLLLEADIFFLPTLLELHSIALLEGMRSKIPVVTSRNVGSHEEFLVDGVNGFLDDPRKIDGWVEKLTVLVEDSSKRKEMGAKGYETFVERFNIRNVSRQYENIYDSVK